MSAGTVHATCSDVAAADRCVNLLGDETPGADAEPPLLAPVDDSEVDRAGSGC